LSERGEIKLTVDYGQERASGEWFCPVRRGWGWRSRQRITPAWAQQLGFTVTATGFYEEAAAVASCWGRAINDSTLRALGRGVGARAQAQAQARDATLPKARRPAAASSAVGVALVDGCQVRERGRLADKGVVGWMGEPLELGRRLQWAAQCEGVGRAREVVSLGDGAAWVWNLKDDRFATAHRLLDFCHAGQPLWEVGRGVRGEAQPALGAWGEPRRHQLRHGRERAVLEEAARRKKRGGPVGKCGPAETVPLQAGRTILDAPRSARSARTRGSPPQSPLRPTLVSPLITNAVRMHPTPKVLAKIGSPLFSVEPQNWGRRSLPATR
jgi:hypothetical protein